MIAGAASASEPAAEAVSAPAAPKLRGLKARPPRGTPREKRIPKVPTLLDTPGPDPATPLEDVRLAVGTIVGVFGVAGELKVRLSTDDPDRLLDLKRIWVGDEPRPRRVMGVRFHAGMALLTLQFVANPEDARTFVGQTLRVAGTDVRPPEPGEYFLYQLMGLTAYDEAGATIGIVTDLMETGANDVFVISPPGGGADVLLPNHPDVVLAIDPPGGRMVIRPLDYGDEPQKPPKKQPKRGRAVAADPEGADNAENAAGAAPS